MKKLSRKFNAQSGKISQTLIVLAVVLLILIVIVFFIVKIASRNPSTSTPEDAENQIPEPEYETTMSDTRFLFVSAQDLGNVLPGKAGSSQKDLVTTEKFIRVTVAAQNKGKVNTSQYSWNIGNLVDSDGRNFVPLTQRAYYFLPQPDLCGALLKPEFEPTPCVKIYEVSKASTNLKVTLTATGVTGRKEAALIDIIVQ
ncbi:MAG: hypothetical protein Q7S10_00960 [bacterium]|nr:hypothetical protein [bacterium]